MQTAVSPGEFRRYAAPGVLGMIGISCYILADTFFVAKAPARSVLPRSTLPSRPTI